MGAVPRGIDGARPRDSPADFRPPVYKSEVTIPTPNVVGGDNANVDVRLSFLSGGPASGDVVTVRSRFDARTRPVSRVCRLQLQCLSVRR